MTAITPQPLELVPEQAKVSKPLFSSEADYQEFRHSYKEEITPQLERFREARRQSEEEAKQHWTL